jgi:hypothetical protein
MNRKGTVTKQQKYKLPVDLILWVRIQAAERGRYPADVVAELLSEARARREKKAAPAVVQAPQST